MNGNHAMKIRHVSFQGHPLSDLDQGCVQVRREFIEDCRHGERCVSDDGGNISAMLLQRVGRSLFSSPYRPHWWSHVPSRFLASPAVSVDVSPGDADRLERQRNIGISAHIDSGKTTLTERILYYTGRISSIHEVKGKDGVGAKMDSMELEREKGITIASAATHAKWNGNTINIIDTPGHVDFTIEVERALRVLDGAVLVLCGVSGVQSQSLTVDRQMKRYGVPRLTFINKLDRAGSNPWRIIQQVEAKLGLRAAAVHVPMGLESDFAGIIDVITNEAVYFDGDNGETIRRTQIPPEFQDIVKEKRRFLIETLADVDDHIADLFLMEEPISNDDIHAAIRRSTLQKRFSPVLMGSALKNTGVQTLLDAVLRYLPNPLERENTALKQVKVPNPEDETSTIMQEQKIELRTDSAHPLVSLAFKLEESRFGQLTYVRVYQGTLGRGDVIVNTRTNKKVKVPRLVRMHSNEMEEIQEARAGDICAMFGLECASGDTFVSVQEPNALSLESLFIPEPVMSLAIAPKKRDSSSGAFSKALQRFCKEDPTFRTHLDTESMETIISGMGELHLQIYVERMKREYKVDVDVGAPRVNYRETIRRKAKFNYLHKKQSGGAGQFAGLEGYLEPIEDRTTVEFKNGLIGNNVPPDFLPAIEKGFREALQEGSLTGHRVQGVRMCVLDGRTHPVDSNELAFRMASIQGFRQAFAKAQGCVLEPVMKVEVEAPIEFQGTIMGGLSKRRGIIMNSSGHSDYGSISAEVPLGEMFGYSTELRSMTQGKGEYAMEYMEHRPLPDYSHLVEAYQERKKEGR